MTVAQEERKSPNGSVAKVADFEVDAIFGGFEAGQYPKISLIINGAVRQYEPSRGDFDGELPEVGVKVHVELEGYRVNVTAVAKAGSHYTRTVETLNVLRMRPVK